MGVFAVVVAAGVVVAEGEVDGGMGEGLVQAEGDEGDGLGGEGGEIGGGGVGREGVKAAIEQVRREVAGEGDEEGVGLLGMGGGEAGLKQSDGGVDATGAAGALEVSEVVGLSGAGGGVEDGGPGGDGGGAEFGEPGGVVEGIEVDVGEEEDGDGLRGCGLRSREGHEGEGGEEREESEVQSGPRRYVLQRVYRRWVEGL